VRQIRKELCLSLKKGEGTLNWRLEVRDHPGKGEATAKLIDIKGHTRQLEKSCSSCWKGGGYWEIDGGEQRWGL